VLENGKSRMFLMGKSSKPGEESGILGQIITPVK
jgi:hypothetical protein